MNDWSKFSSWKVIIYLYIPAIVLFFIAISYFMYIDFGLNFNSKNPVLIILVSCYGIFLIAFFTKMYWFWSGVVTIGKYLDKSIEGLKLIFIVTIVGALVRACSLIYYVVPNKGDIGGFGNIGSVDSFNVVQIVLVVGFLVFNVSMFILLICLTVWFKKADKIANPILVFLGYLFPLLGVWFIQDVLNKLSKDELDDDKIINHLI